jgi:hypothetical protein
MDDHTAAGIAGKRFDLALSIGNRGGRRRINCHMKRRRSVLQPRQ